MLPVWSCEVAVYLVKYVLFPSADAFWLTETADFAVILASEGMRFGWLGTICSRVWGDPMIVLENRESDEVFCMSVES